jgi:hypothetical protein
MDQFADIRPFNDDEVPSVLNRLIADDEMIVAVASLKFGAWQKYFSPVVNAMVRFYLKRQLRGVNTVDEFQHVIEAYMDDMIESTTTGVSVSGLDQLDPAKPYLFLSNHRDIALDPALVNYALYHHKHETARIAIGDNLLTKPYVSDLMRINKSFIVKRSAKVPRKMLAAYKMLSAYIRYSIETDKSPIWMAQREGRAKDGLDRTEPAIIKMLSMSINKKDENFSDYINTLNIVPVAISYELDPCDGAKAQELYEKAHLGSYQKAEDEDVNSIARGISGHKGQVHVSFGKPLVGDFDDAEGVAGQVDQQVIGNYVLQPSNFFAYKILHGDYPENQISNCLQDLDDDLLAAKEKDFKCRIEALPEAHRAFALDIYANPVNAKQQLTDG